MREFERLDGFADEVDGLERALGDVSGMAATFRAELGDMRDTLSLTAQDISTLERGFSSGLKRAFDGLVLDGASLADTLRSIGQSMADTAYNAAVKPVTDHFGGMLAQGVGALFNGAFADGGSFVQGRVMPFAQGGIISQATAFPMRGGLGLMGEAGPEAIMPLARGADGALGVKMQGGSAVNVTMNITTPNVQGFQRSQGQVAAQVARALGRGQRNR